MGSQTDSEVTESRKFHAYHWLMRFYNVQQIACDQRLALGDQTVIFDFKIVMDNFEISLAALMPNIP